jgi:ATP-dependent Lhr-like helicase
MAGGRESQAFRDLDPRIQRWVWRRGWDELRDIQEEAIPRILHGGEDVLIAAGTARGKTEAAFLPILSAIAQPSRQLPRPLQSSAPGVQALCFSPLKALINDQFHRLEELCTDLDIPLNRWHGDVAAGFKRRLLRDPRGVLVITPESVEALFVLHGWQIASLFAGLSYCVVDELHAFIGTERGRQLQSQLHRLELALARRIPRIGLSATLGDMNLAAEFLRPGGATAVHPVVSSDSGREVRLQVRGYQSRPPPAQAAAANGRDDEALAHRGGEAPADDLSIARHLFATLRGGHHLIFANSRTRVEVVADRLRRQCKDLGVPNEFWPHHGNLSKSLREETEAAIKDRSRPATAVCTTTLELGIDIGAIESIAQLGSPPSVASARQRLGRSGRAGGPAILRVYITERELRSDSAPGDALRTELIQTIATLQLLLAGWCEPAQPEALHLSTLVQQLLSLIAQHGAVRAAPAWADLCERGAFPSVSQAQFAAVLRSLASHSLIQQDHSGELVLGEAGERLVNHYGFYAAFSSPDEYRVVAGGRALGNIPVRIALVVGSLLIFAGRRWRIVAIDPGQKTIDVQAAAGGRPPAFTPTDFPPVHDRVRQEMFEVLRGTSIPVYLDAGARDLLLEARANFARFRLAEVRWQAAGDTALVFSWCGDRVLETLRLWLRALGHESAIFGVALGIAGVTDDQIRPLLAQMADGEPPAAIELARFVANLGTEKFHAYLSDELLAADYASCRLDVAGARNALRRLLA